MAKLDRYLLRSEDQVFSVRRHWVSLASAGGRLALLWFAGLLILWLVNSIALLRSLLVVFFVVTLAWFAWIVADWYVERFVVTNKRVLLVTGILTRKVAIMPLVKVTDLTYEQTAFGRLLDYGSFIIESAGQEQALSRIDYLPDPNLRYHQVSELLFGRYAVQTQDDGTGGLWPIAPAGPTRPGGYEDETSRTTSPLPRIPPEPRPPRSSREPVVESVASRQPRVVEWPERVAEEPAVREEPTSGWPLWQWILGLFRRK